MATAPAPIESFEMVGGGLAKGFEFQARQEVGVNSVYYGLKFPQPWAPIPGESLVRGTNIQIMNRASTELPPRAAVGGKYLFAAGNNGILRFDRQASDRNSAPAAIHATSGQHPFYPAAGIASGSDLMVLGERLYWGEVNGSTIQVWSHTVEPGGPVILHAQTGYSGANALYIKRFARLNDTESLALTWHGALYVFRHDDLFTDLNGPSGMTLLATGVTGFAARQETYSHSGIFYPDDAIYYTLGHTLQGIGPAAELRRIRRGTAGAWLGSTLLHSTSIGASGYYDTLTEVAADRFYIYLRKAAVSNTAFGILAAPADTTLRAESPAEAPGSGLTFAAIPANGNNLRTDDRYLYFASGASVKRVPNDVEPIPVSHLDFEALGVEITQSIQTMDHGVDLVVGKRTLVRGFARQRVNQNTGAVAFSPFATVRVFFTPAWPLGSPESELTAVPAPPLELRQRPQLGDGALHEIRYNAKACYLWELPQSFTQQAGRMRVEFRIHPEGETRDPLNITLDPALNNVAHTQHAAGGGVFFRPVHNPALVFVPVRTMHVSYSAASLAAENLGPFLGRAATLLPVSGLRAWVANGTEIVSGYEGGKFNMSKDYHQNEALRGVVAANMLISNPPGAGDAHWIGAVHQDARNGVGEPVTFNGLGTFWEESVVRLSKNKGSDGSTPWNAPAGGVTLAHELGHNWDLGHVLGNPPGGQVPEPPYETGYPYPTAYFGTGSLGLANSICGYDPITNTAINSTQAGDLMSYMNRRWVSDYTWNHLVTEIPSEDLGIDPPPPPLSQLLISASRDSATGAASMEPLIRLDSASIAANTLGESAELADNPAPELVCRQYDAAGVLLGETPLTPRNDGEIQIIGQYVAAQPGVARVELVDTASGAAIAGSQASGAAPVCAIAAVEHDPATERVRVSWTGSDADGDPLVFTLRYHCVNDAGESVRVLRARTTDLSADLARCHLPGGTGHFSLIASDGFHSTEVAGEDWMLPDCPPNLAVTGISAGQQLDVWAADFPGFRLCATALDGEDATALDPAAIAWSWTGPESGSATGCEASPGKLPPGDYTLTAGITDSAGQLTTREIPFTVPALAVLDAPSMTLDGIRQAEDYGNAPVAEWTLSGGGAATTAFSHHAGALHLHMDGIPYGADGIGAGFLIDLDGSGSGTLDAGDMAIEVNAEGTVSFWTGAGGFWQPAGAPSSLVEARLFQGATDWSMELRVPDDVIGGWDHAARMRCYVMKTWPYDAFPSASDHGDTSTWMPVHFGARPEPPTAAPTAVATGEGATTPQAADVFRLDGSASTTAQGDTAGLQYEWTQIAGPAVVLNGADQPVAGFSLGPISEPVALVFQLVVSHNGVASAPAAVTCYFTPAPETFAWAAPDPGPGGLMIVRNGDGSVTVSCDANRWFGPGGLAVGEDAEPIAVAGAMFELQTSADLTDWTELGLYPANAAGFIEARDTAAAGVERRFYRFARATGN